MENLDKLEILKKDPQYADLCREHGEPVAQPDGSFVWHTQEGGSVRLEMTAKPPAEAPAANPPPADDEVDHPPQYTKGAIECIDAIDSAVAGVPPDEAVCVANVVKYVWRYNAKGGAVSLRKARWYLDRLIAKVDAREAAGS